MKKLSLFLLSLVFAGNSFAQSVDIPEQKPDISFKNSSSAQSRSSGDFKIIALVNGDLITGEDIKNRINAFVMTTQIPLNEQTRPLISQKVLQNAVDEKLKIQDAEKNGIIISNSEINAAVASFEKNNSIRPGGMESTLKKAGVSQDAFREQIKADLAWLKLVRKKNSSNTLTQKEIEQAEVEAKEDLSIQKYMVSEILIKKNNAKDIDALVTRLREDPRFELYAMQFSQSPSASNGGKLGWVNKGKLLPQLEKALSKMQEGDVSNAVNINGDYHILKLHKVFDPDKDRAQVPSEEDIKKFLENQKLEAFSADYLQKLRSQALIELRN